MRILLALLLTCLVSTAQAAGPKPAEVAVLATLHKLHAEVPAYSGQVLRDSILRLAPDVLCIEVRPDRYAQRAPEANKVEYPEVVYPLIDAQGYRVYPMEPAPPRFEALLQPYLQANRAFAEAQPAEAAAFSAHAEAMYAPLRAYWTSAARVNDAVTDQQMRAKHALQDALIGEGERAGWEAWNGEFLAAIERAAAENPGKRIVVLVGAEHGYWLRERLAGHAGIRLLDTAALLAD
jgi:hypothetical protein